MTSAAQPKGSTSPADRVLDRATPAHRLRPGAAVSWEQSSTWHGPLAVLGAASAVFVVLVALNGLYMGLVVFGNISDFDSNRAFVHHVLTMDTTNFGQPVGVGLDPAVMWRSITTPWIQDAAYVALISWEAVAAIALVGALVLAARDGRIEERTQALATVGLLMIVAPFVGGFITVGGEWFAMYRSTQWNGLGPAFRNSVLALLTIVLIRQPTPPSTPHAPRPLPPSSADDDH